MAGTVTHLVIADMLLDFLDIKNPSLFYCGNLAPDAVMARENYVREMKKHTHFKDGIPTNNLHMKENFELYRSRLKLFADRFLIKNSESYELYLGYVTHMLADEVFILELRDRHVRELIKRGFNPYDVEYFKNFGHDVDLNDWRLVREYEFKFSMPDILLKESGYEIEDYVTNEELIKSKEYIIKKNFRDSHEEEKTTVLSFEENEEYIRKAVDFIKAVFGEFFSISADIK